MPTLADYRTKILRYLDDPNKDRFDDEDIDSALRSALDEYQERKPYTTVGTFTADGEKDIEVTTITDLIKASRLLWNDVSIGFYQTFQDGVLHIHITETIPSGDTLTLHYTKAHTIEDFDEATETTVTDLEILAIGATGYALLARANSTLESNNLNPSTSETLEKAGKFRLEIFRTRLSGNSGSGFANWTLDTADNY